MNLGKANVAYEALQALNRRTVPVINDSERLQPNDKDLFDKLVKRCEAVNEEMGILRAQLVESK
eukprot:14812898-Heterocapsa_arctica.AAC.1